MRLPPLSLAAVLLISSAAAAQEQRPEHPPPPPEGTTWAPLPENPYFVRDAHDPRVLHKKPDAPRRIDRGYVEMMVRGDLPRETLDLLERDAPDAHDPSIELIEPGALVPSPLAATVVSGNVLVIEGTDALVPNTERGRMFNHNGNGLNIVLNQVFSRLGPDFDFVTVMTTFEDPGAAAYYMGLRNDVSGLGECKGANDFGCIYDWSEQQLQGFAFMNSLGYWRDWDRNMDGVVHPIESFEANVYAVMGQEIGHRWGAGLRFKDPRNGAVSKKLLGRDGSHWAAWVDTDASIHDGWDWEVEGDRFLLVDDMRRFSTLDLYAMGALPVARAEPFFFIDNARFVANQLVGAQSVPADAALQIPSVEFLREEYGITMRATGERVDLTIQDIVDVEGNRCPDPDHTQKSFRQAIVLVTRPGQSAASVAGEVADLELMMATWEDWWADRTGNALTLCTSVTEACEHRELSIGPGEIDDDDGVVEPGEKFELVVPLEAEQGTIENAVARVTLEGNGAEGTYVQYDNWEIGQVDGKKDVRIPLELYDDYTCGYSVIATVSVESDNAPTVTGEYRVFPGYRELFAATFDDGDDGFTANADGLDENERGGFVREDVSLNCTMTPRTPEDDSSPGKGGAFVTGSEGEELDGVASLFSPEISLEGAVDPEIRFMYWLDGAPGAGRLKVSVSGSGKGFTEAKVYEEPYHGWVLGRVRLSEVYEQVPESVWLLIEAEGDGRVEVAIDEVRVLEPAGACAAPTGCLCSAQPLHDDSPPYGALSLAGVLLALGARRRRRS